VELYQEVEKITKILDKAVQDMASRGEVFARARAEYQIALSSRLLELRADGYAVTHLLDIAKGEPKIAELRLKKDIAEGLYKSIIEGINVYKLKLRVLDAQIQREWGQSK